MMTVQELWLIRHGESTANIAAAEAEQRGDEVIAVDHRDADVPLSQLGHRQASSLGEQLAELVGGRGTRGSADAGPSTHVVTSPYRRAVETWATAAGSAGTAWATAAPARDDRLRDRELGVLDRLTRDGVRRRHPEEDERRRWLGKYYHRPPGGESWADVVLRLRSAYRDVLDTDAERVVLVTHDVVVTLTVAVLLGWDEAELLAFAADHPVANASLTRLHRDGPAGAWQLDEFSAVSHLDDDEVTQHTGDRASLEHVEGA